MARKSRCRSAIKVEHAAVITVGKLLAKVVDSVDRLSVASPVVVLKVAPAAVLVDSVKVVSSKDIRNRSRLRSVGLDQRSDVSVGEVVHLVLHGLEAGLGAAGQHYRGGNG